MAKAEWGSKRICQECGSKYYDMRRADIICPKCDAVFLMAPAMPQRVQPGAKESAKPTTPAVATAEVKEAVAGHGETDAIDELKDVGTKGDRIDDDDDEDVIEDTSDPVDDDDDMAEVIPKPAAPDES